MKNFGISDFLTFAESIAAIRLFLKSKKGTFVKQCAEEIITPILPRINEKLGRENDPMLLALMVENIFIKTCVKKKVKRTINYERNGSEH